MRVIDKGNTSPSDVRDGDYCAIKLVAVAGEYNDWACYAGPSWWSDEKVRDHGDEVTEGEALFFSYLMQLRRYRR